jgi:hypothetical protein
MRKNRSRNYRAFNQQNLRTFYQFCRHPCRSHYVAFTDFWLHSEFYGIQKLEQALSIYPAGDIYKGITENYQTHTCERNRLSIFSNVDIFDQFNVLSSSLYISYIYTRIYMCVCYVYIVYTRNICLDACIYLFMNCIVKIIYTHRYLK